LSQAGGSPGDRITITGVNFEPAGALSVVFFGRAEAQVIEGQSERVVVQVPAGAPAGPAPITVVTRAGSSAARAFTVNAIGGAPQVAAVMTTARVTTNVAFVGQTLLVTGTGFSPDPVDNQVVVGGRPVPVIGASPTELTISISASLQSGQVGVTTNGAGSTGGDVVLLIMSSVSSSLDEDTLGVAAPTLLQASPVTHLAFEISLQDDGGTVEPLSASLDFLRDELEARLFKPGGVFRLAPAPFASGDSSWAEFEVRNQAGAVRRFFSRGNTVVVHLTVFKGQFEDDPNVVGLAFDATSVALFEEQLLKTLGPTPLPGARERVEQAVMLHEVGHLLGLVDFTTPQVNDHVDLSSPGHDVNPACVMHGSIRTGGGVAQTPGFDSECLLDLETAGGRPR
jgi:hypothetical protein